MTLLFMDGMDLYGVTSNIVRRYDGVDASVAFGAAFGRFGGGGIKITADDLFFFKNITGDPQTCVVSFAVFRDSAAPASDQVMKWQNATDDGLISLTTTVGSTTINVKRGGLFGTQLGSFTLSTDEWHWMSIKLKAANTGGTFDVEVDGTNVFTFSGDTVSAGTETCNTVYFGADNTQDWSYDDVVITDVAGSAPFNALLSDRRIDTIRPDAAGDSSGFTASPAVANYLNVDDVTPDDDTTYNESGATTVKDLYNMGALGFSPTAIDGVNVVGLVRNPDSGSAAFKMKVKSGTTEGTGGNQTPTASYKYLDEIFLLNPDTSAAWTETNVNSMQAGQEIV